MRFIYRMQPGGNLWGSVCYDPQRSDNPPTETFHLLSQHPTRTCARSGGHATGRTDSLEAGNGLGAPPCSCGGRHCLKFAVRCKLMR